MLHKFSKIENENNIIRYPHLAFTRDEKKNGIHKKSEFLDYYSKDCKYCMEEVGETNVKLLSPREFACI